MRRSSSHHRALTIAAIWAMSTGAGGLAADAAPAGRAIRVESELGDGNRPVVVTVRDAVDRALACDKDIASARDALVDADWQEIRARQLRDPELRLSHSGESNQASARLYVPNPWVRSHRVGAAAAAGNAVSAELERAVWLLETRVRRAFAELDFLDHDLAAVEELVDLRRRALELARQRLRGGQGTTPDLIPVSGRYLTALSERDQAERKRGTARRQLAALVMLPAHRLTLAVDDRRRLPTDLAGLSLLELEQRAIRNRGDLLASSWRARAASAACEESRSERIPWFRHVQASRTEDTGGGDEWSVEVAISLPVFSWSSRKTGVEVTRYHRLQTAAGQASRRVGQEVRSAWHAVEEAFEARRLYEERTNPLVSELNTVHEELRKEDGAFQAQIIDIRIQLLAVERTRLRLKRAVTQALIQLEEAVGTRLNRAGAQ